MVMDTYANRLIDALGGSTKVATLINAPLSTVHSWRRIGIPKSRLDHVKLAAKAARLRVDWDNPPPSRREVAPTQQGAAA